jgi:hypothetical protein
LRTVVLREDDANVRVLAEILVAWMVVSLVFCAAISRAMHINTAA